MEYLVVGIWIQRNGRVLEPTVVASHGQVEIDEFSAGGGGVNADSELLVLIENRWRFVTVKGRLALASSRLIKRKIAQVKVVDVELFDAVRDLKISDGQIEITAQDAKNKKKRNKFDQTTDTVSLR